MHAPDALRCLSRRNLRLFFGGQLVSLVGTWMQGVAQQWLVWTLTHSSLALGAVTFLGQFPVFVFGTIGGSAADRFERRRLVVLTQVLSALEALALAILALTGTVRPIHVLLLAGLLGVVNSFDIPARQSLLADMAEDDLANAIALNSAVVNGARVVGPAIAGAVLAVLGPGICFLLNAISYVGIIWGLTSMSVPGDGARPKATGAWIEGMRYAFRTPHVRALLGLVALSSIFGLAYVALMPIFATHVLGGAAGMLGWLFSAVGIGALAGAIVMLAQRGLAGLGRRVATGSTAFGLGLLAFSLSRSVVLSTLALAVVGYGYMMQMAATNTLLQGLAPPAMRGRVMGLYSTVFVGMSPLGALSAGALAGRWGAPLVAALGALVVFAGSVAFRIALPRLRAIVRRDYPDLFPVAGVDP